MDSPGNRTNHDGTSQEQWWFDKKKRNDWISERFYFTKVSTLHIREEVKDNVWDKSRYNPFCCFSCYLLTYFTPFSSVSISNFEQVNASWEHEEYILRRLRQSLGGFVFPHIMLNVDRSTESIHW